MKTEIIKEGSCIVLLCMLVFGVFKYNDAINLPWWCIGLPIFICVALGVVVSLLVVIKGIFK